jgi:pimeloyl-ACP methyl ester carboxylesterase
MDHLGIRRFMVIGYCIGGPFIWKLVQRAPERIAAAVVSQPVDPWKDTKEQIPLAVRHVRTFLKANRPA